MNKHDIYEKIKRIVADFIDDYSLDYPLDSSTIAHNLNIKVSRYDAKTPIAKLSDDGFGFFKDGNYHIHYNSEMPYNRVQFTIAHEIGHFVLNDLFQKYSIIGDNQEKYANFFAKYLLAPLPLVFELEEQTPEHIAKVFRISTEVSGYILDSYNKWLEYGAINWMDYEVQIIESQIKPHNMLRSEIKHSWINPDILGWSEYTPVDEYPITDPYITSDKMPDKIIPFSKFKEVRSNIDEYFICFYTDDKEFEKVLRNPDKYLNLFAQSDGIIGFDFSVYDDMPKIEQQHQMFLNQALTNYYGERMVPVIPNIRYGDIENIGDYLQSIPRNIFVAIGTHGQIKTNKQKQEWVKCLELIVEELAPEGIVVYGPHPDDVFKPFEEKGVNFKYFEPWRPPLHTKLNAQSEG